MALTEIQLPEKKAFYGNLQALADEAYRFIVKCESASDFIGFMETSDLDDMSIPTGQVRTDMNDMKVFLIEVVSMFSGNSVTPAKTPKDVINKIRHMRVI